MFGFHKLATFGAFLTLAHAAAAQALTAQVDPTATSTATSTFMPEPCILATGLNESSETHPITLPICATRTTVSTGTASVSPTASSAVPVANSVPRLAAPLVVRSMVILAHSIRALGHPSPSRSECCGDICCGKGEVCTRSWTGAKCWPQAERMTGRRGSVDPGPISEECSVNAKHIERNQVPRDETANVPGNSTTDDIDAPKGGNNNHGKPRPGGGGVIVVGGAHGNRASLLLCAFCMLIALTVAYLPTSFPALDESKSFSGNPQREVEAPSLAGRLSKRWSCHYPKQDCGLSGCYIPGTHVCCMKPKGSANGDYGLCMASEGESCCGSMCCPRNFECVAGQEYLCVPKESQAAI